MCDCVAGWIIDPQVKGAHNVQPVSCSTYIAALEELVCSGTADSLDLERVQKAHGIRRKNPLVPEGKMTVDEDGMGFIPFSAPFITDIVNGTRAWKDEVMARVAATGAARFVLPDGFEISIENSNHDVEEYRKMRDQDAEWVGEYEKEHWNDLQERLRALGYGGRIDPRTGLDQ